jgi:hypothetical protein
MSDTHQNLWLERGRVQFLLISRIMTRTSSRNRFVPGMRPLLLLRVAGCGTATGKRAIPSAGQRRAGSRALPRLGLGRAETGIAY